MSLGALSLDLLLVLIGLADTALVCWFAMSWNMYTGSSLMEAVLFSVSLTGASIVFFEYAVKYLTQVKASGRRSLLGPFALFLLWLVIAAYSINNTTAAQYIGTEREKERYKEAHVNELALAAKDSRIAAEIERIDLEGKRSKDRIAAIDQALARAATPEEAAAYRTTLDGLRRERAGLESDLGLMEQRRSALVAQSLDGGGAVAGVSGAQGALGRDVFGFYRDVLGAKSSDSVQLLLAVFKGVVLDLINILCFMFVMLRRRNGGGETAGGVRGAARGAWGRAVVLPEGSAGGAGSGERADEPCLADGGAAGGPGVAHAADPAARLAAFIYRAKGQSSNGTLLSQRRAYDQLGIERSEYEALVEKGLRHGVLRRRGGRTFVVPGYSEDEFVREVR